MRVLYVYGKRANVRQHCKSYRLKLQFVQAFMGRNIRSESRGAIRAVQLAGDSCLCNQVRGLSLHAAERYQRWDAEDGTAGTGQDRVRGGGSLLVRASSGWKKRSVGQ